MRDAQVDMNTMLAAFEQRAGEENPLQGKDTQETIHAYPVEGGYVLLSRTPLEEDQQPETVSDSKPPQPAPKRESPHVLSFVFILLVFLVLDSADSTIIALMIPTVNITITPNVKTITLSSSMQLGKLLSPLTISESQTTPTTGHGHQDAARATGSLTFYNGSNTAQNIAAGTDFTGSDGLAVVTAEQVTIPAAIAPQFGEATVAAQAQNVGAKGNIPADDVNLALSSDLTVKNLAPFTNGQDARDYQVVTQADRDSTAATLKAKVSSSMTAALQGQLMLGESIQPTPCTPTTTADHAIGEEATHVTVSVSETCNAIAYNTQALSTQATRLLTTQATKKFGQGYTVSGNIHVSVTKVTTQHKTGVLLSFTTQGTYVYQLTPMAQERIVTLVAGKPRKAALHQLATLPGLSHVSISGISDNQPLPDDVTHIHLLIIVEGERTWAIQP